MRLLSIFLLLFIVACNNSDEPAPTEEPKPMISYAAVLPTGRHITYNKPNIILSGDSIRTGDVITLAPGKYNWTQLNKLVSKAANWNDVNSFITIRAYGAELVATDAQTWQNYGTGLWGVRIVGLTVQPRPEPLLRMQGGYSGFIWFDSCTFNGSMPFVFNYDGAPYNGNLDNTYSNWRVWNCKFNGTWKMQGGGVALGFGNPFNIKENSYFRDIEIAYNEFDNYPSPGNNPANYIQGCNVYGLKIHHNRFRNLGVGPTPGGHTSAINLSMCQFEAWSNLFGPNNYGDDFRVTCAGLKGTAYDTTSLVYNCISYQKRKYAFIEMRNYDGAKPATVPDVVFRWVRDRDDMQVHNITCYKLATGSAIKAYYVNSNAIYDWYRGGNVHLYNSVIIGVSDTTYNNPIILAKSTDGPFKFIDTIGNLALKSGGIKDTIRFEPLPELQGRAKNVPAWLKFDYYGNPRGSTIGAVEVIAADKPPVPRKKLIRTVFYYDDSTYSEK